MYLSLGYFSSSVVACSQSECSLTQTRCEILFPLTVIVADTVQIFLQEKKGALDYKGYIKPKSRTDAPTDGDDRVLTLQFTWNGVPKTVGSSFIGTSPEFEIAMFTTCFLVGKESNIVTLNTGNGEEFEINIKCFSMAHGKIGTSYPEAIAHHEI